MMKRLLLIVAAGLVVAGLLYASQFKPQTTQVSGYIEGDQIRVGSRVGGRVAKVLVKEGQQVTEGEKLVEFEPYDLLKQQAQARAVVEQRQAEYEQLVAGLRAEEVDQARYRYEQLKARYEQLKAGPRAPEIKAAKDRLAVAEAQLALAQDTYRREKEIFDRNASTQASLDEAIEKLAVATATKGVREQELTLLEEGTRKEEIAAAEASMQEARAAWQVAEAGYRDEEKAAAKAAADAARAALASIEKRIEELTIVCPIEKGLVESLDLMPGDLAGPGAPVMSILDEQRMWVRAFVPENRLDLKVGQKLSLTVDSYPGEQFQGTLIFVAREAEFTPSNVQTIEERSKQVYRIKVQLDDGLDRLRPGMAADVWLPPQGGGP
jgi:multidrug resistance efflux pump